MVAGARGNARGARPTAVVGTVRPTSARVVRSDPTNNGRRRRDVMSTVGIASARAHTGSYSSARVDDDNSWLFGMDKFSDHQQENMWSPTARHRFGASKHHHHGSDRSTSIKATPAVRRSFLDNACAVILMTVYIIAIVYFVQLQPTGLSRRENATNIHSSKCAWSPHIDPIATHILSSRYSTPSKSSLAQSTVSNLPEWVVRSPTGLRAGECWAFNSRAEIALALSPPFVGRELCVTIHHLTPDAAPSGDTRSAPRAITFAASFQAMTFVNTATAVFDELDSVNFTDVSAGHQSFLLRMPTATTSALRIGFVDNHGNNDFTCVYRISVHTPPSLFSWARNLMIFDTKM